MSIMRKGSTPVFFCVTTCVTTWCLVFSVHRVTSLMISTPLLGLYRRTTPRVLWWSKGGGGF